MTTAEKRAQYRKTYRAKNKEKLLEYQREYRKKNPEKVKSYSKERRKKAETDPVRFIDLMYRAMLDRSRKRQQEMNVDRAYLMKLLNKAEGKCALSGMPITLKTHDPYRVSPDRKNSKKGYVKGNIQFVAACVNIAKNDLTTKEFLKMCKAVAENNS
jgi:hypothetical protein